MYEQFSVLRRIAERGKALAEDPEHHNEMFVDIFNHLLAEIEVTANLYDDIDGAFP